MWKVLQQEQPDDFVVGTGDSRSIREFVEEAFSCLNMLYTIVDLHEKTSDEADAELARLQATEGAFVVQHPRFYRPAEVNRLLADSSKAKRVLGWESQVEFKDLVKMMVEGALDRESNSNNPASPNISN